MKYPYTIYKMRVEDHEFWVAVCPTLKGCVGQGETPEEAFAELSENETAWIETAKEVGIPVPEVPVETNRSYSGKFMVRVAPYVHKEASELAQKHGISLNQYVNDAIVSQNSSLKTAEQIMPVATESIVALKTIAAVSTNLVLCNSNSIAMAEEINPNYYHQNTKGGLISVPA